VRGVVFLGNEARTVREFDDPVPLCGQVRVRLKASGICGSDLGNYRKPPGGPEPRVIAGHEACGIIEAVGDRVKHASAGDRVAVYPLLTCGRCEYCQAGDFMFCPSSKLYGQDLHGSHADLLLTEERNLLPLPDELSFAEGALVACSASAAFSALKKLSVPLEATLAIFGQDPVGLCGLVLAEAMGARVIYLDPSSTRRRLAGALGASATVDPGDRDPPLAILELTNGEGVDMALVASGHPGAGRHALESLRSGGRAALVGAAAELDTLDFSEIQGRQLTLVGSSTMPVHVYSDLVRLLVDKRVPLERTVTHRFPIEQAQEAFRVLAEGKTGKVVFEWS